MHLNSTVENLKETISIYTQKNEGIETKCIYSDNLLRMYNDIDFKKDDKIELQILAVSVPFFEFNQTKLEDCQFFTINVVIKDDEFGIEFTEKIESKYELSIYSVTVMLEKKFGIERSLFIPFDGNGDKIQLNEVVTSEQNSLLFKIFDSLTVEIDGNEKKFSYLTQISDIQMMNNFTNHNFAIIINNHFIYKKPDGYSLLCNFMTNSKETTKLILKKAKEPCYQKIIKDQNYFCKYSIIPKKMEIEQITQNYLRRNLNSVDILKIDDNEIVFKNSNRQIIKYILIKENNRSYERSIEIAGNNLFIKDLLFEIYGSKGYFGLFSHNTKENTQFEVTMSKSNYKKFKFWEPLSSIKMEKNNIITIKEINGPKEILIMNLIDNTFYCEKIPIVRKNTNEIIDYFCSKQKLDKNNTMLYSDFNELSPADIPSIFQLDHQFLIINIKSNKKTLNIKNKYQLKIEITVEKKNYSNAASIICDIFKLHINEVRITATINDKNYILPMKFDAGSLPDHCEMLIEYDEDDHVSELMTYKYKNENKVLHISYINSIESSIKILQKEFKLWHLSKSAIYLSFHSFIFPPTKELVSYRIPKKAPVTIRKKNHSCPILIKIPEMKNFEKYYFSKNDKIRDVIQHFKDKFGGRKLILSVDGDGTMEVDENINIYKNMKLFLISKKIKFNFPYSEKGTIEISEILEIKDAVQYLNEKSESNVYIFKCIFNPVHYEPVQENKLLYQFNCPLCISKYYSSIEFNYSIFQNKEYISEYNTIGWLKNTYINKSLLIDAKNYDIVKDKKRIYDYEELRSILNNYEEKLYIEVNPKELEKIRTVQITRKKYKPLVKKIGETSENEESMEEPKIITSEIKEIETINVHDNVEDEINQLMNIFLNQVEPIDNESTSLNEEDENEDDIFTSKKSKICGLSTSFIDKYKKDIIGKGATSCVYKFYKYPDQIFALKVLDIDVIKREEDDSLSINYDKMKRFLAEYEVLCQFDDPKIIRAYGICLGDAIHGPSILLEYCPNNLKQKIKNMNDSERIETIFELSESMKNIHNAGIIHRDLKPENILIDENNHIKVSDFGICTFIELDSESLSRTTYVGTMKCMAPEIRNEQKHYTEKVDVYSFGVVVYYILTKGDYPEITFVEVANGKQAKIPESFSKFSTHLIQQCWSFEPINRPSFDEIYENLRTHKNELI